MRLSAEKQGKHQSEDSLSTIRHCDRGCMSDALPCLLSTSFKKTFIFSSDHKCVLAGENPFKIGCSQKLLLSQRFEVHQLKTSEAFSMPDNTKRERDTATALDRDSGDSASGPRSASSRNISSQACYLPLPGPHRWHEGGRLGSRNHRALANIPRGDGQEE